MTKTEHRRAQLHDEHIMRPRFKVESDRGGRTMPVVISWARIARAENDQRVHRELILEKRNKFLARNSPANSSTNTSSFSCRLLAPEMEVARINAINMCNMYFVGAMRNTSCECT